jgi:hypothetical protein
VSTNVRRDQAKRHLLRLVSFGPGGHPPLREAGPPQAIAARRRADMHAAATVFVELGWLSEDETAEFRARQEQEIAARDRKPAVVA